MTHRTMWTVAALLAAALTLPTIGSAQKPSRMGTSQVKNIVEIAVASGNFNTLMAAVKAAGLVETLSGPGPFTVFAPTDAAFAKLPPGAIKDLLADKERLTAVLTYHVLSGTVLADQVIKAGEVKPATINGQALDIVVRGGKVYVNGAQVITADLVASNGVIHVIEGVLMPKPAAAPAGR